MNASARLSVRLQDIAQSLAEVLDVVAGAPIALVLVLQADKAAQYISNASRQDGRELLKSLMDRWDANRADIPAHYNPDLHQQPKEPLGEIRRQTTPCGECHLQPGERCDICGALQPKEPT